MYCKIFLTHNWNLKSKNCEEFLNQHVIFETTLKTKGNLQKLNAEAALEAM